MIKLLEVKNLCVYFSLQSSLLGLSPKKTVYAVDDVSFNVYQGETLGILGESGCGKSSLARALVGLNPITSGSIIFNGETLADSKTVPNEKNWRIFRKDIQFIFQDSIASLNPRMTVLELISEPLKTYYPKLSQEEVTKHVLSMMEKVGLSEYQLHRYAQEFSGGQCQRISIARALILQPKLIICDESVSALDVSIKSQIINLLKVLQKQLNLTIIFISHDLGVVKHLCDRVMVMYLGHVMEIANNESLYVHPRHPYTQALLSAVLIADPDMEHQKELKLLEGDFPSPTNPPPGCVFSTRCPIASAECQKARPPLLELPEGTKAACIKVKANES